MATTKTIQATVKNRTDTAANWTQKNPVLAEGEIIVVQTSAGETRLKIGDGVKTFTQLPYTDEQIYNNVVTSVNGSTGDVTIDTPVQPDWNQNDETAKDYVKNRICYVKDPALIGGVKFVATSNVELTRTMVDEDRAFMGKLYALCFETAEGTGKNNLKIEVDACTYLSRIYFDRGNFYINGEISGGGYYNVGREWTLTIGAENANLVTGQSYEVTFISNIEDVVTIPVKYFSKEIYRQGNSPVDFGDGTNSTVQGYLTTASGNSSHAEGYYTTASGDSSHAEGSNTTASGRDSHAEGSNTTASGGYSHVAGTYNIPDNTNYSYQVSSPNGMTASTSVTTYLCAPSYSIDLDKGEFILSPKSEAFVPTESAKNIYVLDSAEPDKLYFISGFQGKFVDKILYNGYSICLYKAGALQGGDQRRKYAEIIGNGESDTERSNAYTLDWNGNGWFSGDVYVSSNSGTNKDEGSKKLATEQWVEDKNYLTEHQDVSNLATKAEVEAVEGKVPTNVVQYTEQTLTDEQKKQARENIGAGEANNGLTKVDLYYQKTFAPSPTNFSLFLKQGNLSQYKADASENIIIAFQNLYYIFNSDVPHRTNNDLEDLTKGMYEAYAAGIMTVPLIIYGSPFEKVYPRVHVTGSSTSLRVMVYFSDGSYASCIYDATAGKCNNVIFESAPIIAETGNLSTTLPAVSQFLMKADPTWDMQVATKNYVDSSIPTVPDSLKNPNALTFTGAATGTYDGSEAVTINIPEGGSSSVMKKLTFTGGATGEYDGSSDVSIEIPKERFYELHMTDTGVDDTYTIENDFDEIIAADKAGKIIIWDNMRVTLSYDNNPTECEMYFGDGVQWTTLTLKKATKTATLSDEAYCLAASLTSLESSGAIYWDSNNEKCTIENTTLVVNFTNSDEVLSSDKTIEQIAEAYAANIRIVALYAGFLMPLLCCNDNETIFFGVIPWAGHVRIFYSSSDNSWTCERFNGETYIVKVTNDGTKISCETTASQIYNYYVTGYNIILQVNGQVLLPMTSCLATVAVFCGVNYDVISETYAVYSYVCNITTGWSCVDSKTIQTYKAGNGISIANDGTISVTTATYYSGTSTPANTLGADGDLYLQTEG